MKLQTTLAVIAAIIITACHTSKKTAAPVATAPPPPPPAISTSTSTLTTNAFIPRPANGVYPPGNAELAAMQARYSDITLDKLKEGHAIYTIGPCIKCHGPMNIYVHSETEWKYIIDDMAQRAMMGDAQKDAVYKYVLAIKATQIK